MSRIVRNSCPKFNVYLVSKTCLLISLRISFKIFFIVIYFEMTSCIFTSLVWLLTVGWVMVELSSNPAQLLYNEPSLIGARCCLSAPLCCSSLAISMKESHRHFSYCHSSAPLVLIGSLSLNTCCSNYWLWMVTTTTTLTSTLLVLSSLCFVMALELLGLILNMYFNFFRAFFRIYVLF